jgi:hypothetical protein
VTTQTGIPDWETLLAHAALLQTKIPAAILVGGTAAALHAGHRISFDHDHVIKDMAKNYDAAILALESIAGWRTHRRLKGKMVLGTVNKIGAGLRNQRRSAPLETTEVSLPDGHRLRLPTIEETLRIKTFLLVDRNATRDYLDVAALSHHTLNNEHLRDSVGFAIPSLRRVPYRLPLTKRSSDAALTARLHWKKVL